MEESARTSADFAALRQQVQGVVSDHHELNATVNGLAVEMRSSFSAIQTKLDRKSEVPWGALSVILGFVTVIGTLAYRPIVTEQDDFKYELRQMRSDIIPRNELQAKQDETAKTLVVLSDRISKAYAGEQQTAVDVAYINGQLHPLVPLAPKQ